MGEVQYLLSMQNPHTHLFEVEVRVRSRGSSLDLVMPSWTPGSYLMREFPRNVQDFTASTDLGEPLTWRKIDKNSWRIDTPPEAGIRATYRVYANELSVRTSHLDATHAFVNGASVFMYVRGLEAGPLTVEIDAPPGWQVTSSLQGPGPRSLRAESYDRLVDSPMEIGTHELLTWEQAGIPHRFAVWGGGEFDRERLVADTRRIIDVVKGLFGGLPYDRYLFILHVLPEGRGGLEHADSCALQVDRAAFSGDGYESLLALIAHEFFHVWNVKRIRPETLGPFDYTRETYTRNLFVAEGLTTYYTDLILRWAGLISPERFLERLGDSIARLQAQPGRHHQSLEEASFDTWIKFYRPDEHTPNSQISYYHKGALVGMLLDMEIRRSTGGECSLDDLMQLLWERYGSRDIGFPEDTRTGIQALAEEVSGTDLQGFFDAYLRGTAELDYDRCLAIVGLRLARQGEIVPPTGPPGARSARASDAALLEARLGVRTRERDGRVKISHVLEGTPGYAAGVNAGDEIVALDGLRARTPDLSRVLREKASGELEITVLRRDQLLTLPVVLGSEPGPKPQVARIVDATAAQQAELRRWLRVGDGSTLDPIPVAS